MSVERQFERRAAVIPKLGFGLSVDVYSPDLWDLMNRFDGASVRPAYLEIFRAPAAVLSPCGATTNRSRSAVATRRSR